VEREEGEGNAFYIFNADFLASILDEGDGCLLHRNCNSSIQVNCSPLFELPRCCFNGSKPVASFFQILVLVCSHPSDSHSATSKNSPHISSKNRLLRNVCLENLSECLNVAIKI
jgi:hypothetical protein